VGLGSVTPAIATTTFQLSNNLSATTPIGGTFSSPTTVYDSLGTNHVVTVNYTKTAANTWSYSVTMPSADLSSGSGTATTTSAASFAFGTSAQYTTDTLSGSATIQVGSSGTPVTISAAGDTGAQFLASLQSNATLQAEGVTATLSGSTITLSGPSGLSISNSVADSTTPSALAYTQPTPVTSTVLATGSLTFDASGNLTSPTSNVAVTIPTFADGAAAMDLTWDLTGSGGSATITQTSLASAANSPTQNGQASGTLSSISVLSDGTIEGIYSNSQSHSLGQVAVATFANEQGLLRTGSNDYEATVGSGLAAVGTANTGGRGTITGGSVEASNVDVAAEFSKMIVAQQAYSANAKAITTFQSISEATIAMISA
jgi:flagellar hook protein FlgE